VNFMQAVRAALDNALADRSVVLLSQLARWGLGGLTSGLYERHGDRVMTVPVAENLMHGAAMGMALAGMRPVVLNERIDFLMLAMDPLVNHIPIWPMRERMSMPLTVISVVGKGKGQGPQHSKNLVGWFRSLDGWDVLEPTSPESAAVSLKAAIFGSRPTMYVLHREFFKSEGEVSLPVTDRVRICGASQRHERAFYEGD
jgi:pyruvate/2-oxoglutarate/acetoin dehydrogenase E1 component